MDVQNEANLPSFLKSLYHSYTLHLDKTEIPKAFCSIFKDSAQEISFETQNFNQNLCSTKLSIVKCDKQKKKLTVLNICQKNSNDKIVSKSYTHKG